LAKQVAGSVDIRHILLVALGRFRTDILKTGETNIGLEQDKKYAAS
jgi:hypothetical protein